MSRARELAKLGGAGQQVIAGVSSFVGVSTFASDVFMLDDLTVSGNLNVTGDLTYDEVSARNQNVTGITTTVDLIVSRNASVTGILTASKGLTGNINATGVSTAAFLQATTINVSGASTIGGLTVSAGVIGNLNASGVSTAAYLQATNINASGIGTASRFVSTVATGTAPLTVSSTTAVTNLNADLLDGQHAPSGTIVGTSDTQTLTNKTLTTPVISSISNSGTLTLPTSTDTLVGRATTDTLTNKTLTSPTLTTPVLGTPSSGTLTNCTGLPVATGIANLGTGVATFLTTASSANLASAVTDETGSGALVFGTTPTLVNPTITGSVQGNINASGVSTAAFLQATTVNVSAGASVGGNLVVTGDLTVNGTTVTINSTTLTVDDKNIELGSTASPTDVTADGGGITLKGTTDKTLNWVDATDAWTSSEDFNLLTGKQYEINGTSVLSSTTLGSGVVNSSLTSVGTLGNLTVSGGITGRLNSSGVSTITQLQATTVNATGVVTATSFSGSGSGITGLTNSNLSGSAGITNANLQNSTISGVSLGSNLNALTISTGLSGSSYNGSGVVTIAIDSTVATLTGTQNLTNKTLTSPTLTTPILGTPSSGTLTNCTALPITGITSSTTIGLGVGAIELGHASDTSITRSAAGTVQIEGVTVATATNTLTLTNKTIGAATISGNLVPNANNTIDLGSSANRWANVYSNDLDLSNEGGANSIDGTWGSYLIQEGEEHLYIINRRSGKKFRFVLEEV